MSTHARKRTRHRKTFFALASTRGSFGARAKTESNWKALSTTNQIMTPRRFARAPSMASVPFVPPSPPTGAFLTPLPLFLSLRLRTERHSNPGVGGGGGSGVGVSGVRLSLSLARHHVIFGDLLLVGLTSCPRLGNGKASRGFASSRLSSR